MNHPKLRGVLPVVFALLIVCSSACSAVTSDTRRLPSPPLDGKTLDSRTDAVHGGTLITTTSAKEPRYRPDRILVKPKKGLPGSEMARLHASTKARVLRSFPAIGNLQVVELPKGADVIDFIARYKKSGKVEYAEPDYLVHMCATSPNDPYYLDGTLWGLNNTGQNGGTADADIDAPEGWDIIHDAPNVVVAVIDTGVRYTHEDLAANMWVNPGEIAGNGVDDDGNGYVDDVYGMNAITNSGNPSDDNGHGTHVAGTIGAVGNNGKGVVGVAWQVKIMACKFLDSTGTGYTSDAIKCVDYVRTKGAHILNNSWGGGGYSQALYDAIATVRGAGIIFVASSGNGGGDGVGDDNDVMPQYPASYDLDNIVSVAATDRNDALASFSNYGLQSVDLAAPGVDIYSTSGTSDSAYVTLSGTSMAAPCTSGVMALIKAQFPGDSYGLAIGRLLASVDPLPVLEGKCLTGGRVNLQKALTAAPPDLSVAPVGGLRFGGQAGGPFGPANQTYELTNYGSANLSWTATSTQSWLTVSPTSGTLLPGESASVTLSVNSNANSLAEGGYTDSITFTNTTTGSGDTTRAVTLSIGVIRVKPTGDDGNDGSSWLSAKKTVQAALDASGPGQEVWVAQGTYVENITLESGVGLYGGFAGTETARDQRDWSANVTILDGNQAGSVVRSPGGCTETTVVDGFTIRNGSGTSTYYGPSGGGIYCYDSSPTIMNNSVTGNSASYGGGIWCEYSISNITHNTITNNTAVSGEGLGGGIGCFYLPPTIRDNTITGNAASLGGGIECDFCAPAITTNTIAVNTASRDGGGIDCYGSSATIAGNTITGNTSSSGGGVFSRGGTPTITNNLISANRGDGGGIYCDGPSATIADNRIIGNTAPFAGGGGILSNYCEATIVDNTIADNSAEIEGGGGGIKSWYSNAVIKNNRISGNRASSGGGILADGYAPTIGGNGIIGNFAISGGGGILCKGYPATITNNTIAGNGAGAYGGGIQCSSSSTVVNNIVAFNSTGVYRSSGTPTLRNNDVYGNAGYNYSAMTDPTGTDGNISVDPILAGLEYGNVHIHPDSPCREAGDDSAVGPEWVDMDGQSRIQGTHVDIGADESDGTAWSSGPYAVIRVTPAGNDANDGSAWDAAHAKRTVQAGIDAASAIGGDVWVKAGTYYERITLRSYAYVYGGFAGMETARGERDWTSNITILDGGGVGTVVTSMVGNHVSIIDGFTIRNGHALRGGGIYCAAPTILRNNSITANSALQSGGGVYCGSLATIEGNSISSNTASSGAGVYCSSAATITDNRIAGNAAGSVGGGIFSVLSSPTIANNMIVNNTASSYGGGVYCSSSPATITNNTIVGNTGSSYGAGIGCYSSSPTVANNIVAFNSSGVYKSSGAPNLRSNDVYGNTVRDYSGLSAGEGDISQDPLFVDRPGADYHLTAGSPSINVGWNGAPGLPVFDMDGEGRIFNWTVDIGADEYWSPELSVPNAKAAANGAVITGTDAIVTAAFQNFFYVENSDRSSGIRIERVAHGLNVGTTAAIAGKITTNSDGEKCVEATSAMEDGVGSVEPLMLINRAVGGSDWNYTALTGTGQQGVSGGSGLNNIGLYVDALGRVTFVDTENGFFYLDDGSAVEDGSGHLGVKTLGTVPDPDPVGKYVEVTGISSCYRPGSDLLRLIRSTEVTIIPE